MFTKHLKKIFIASFFCLTTLAFASEDSSWKSMMVSFIEPLQKFYSLDLNKKNYNKKDVQTIRKVIQKFKKSSGQSKMEKITVFSKQDPAIKFKYESFLNSLKYAENSLQANPNKSVFYLKHAIGQCASCHSSGGPSTEFFKNFSNKNIPLAEKGRLALALRDFESSSEIYKSLLFDKKNHKNMFEIRDHLTSYLNSSILGDTKKSEILRTLSKVKRRLGGRKSKNLNLNSIVDDISKYKSITSLSDAQEKMNKIQNENIQIESRLYSVLKIKNYLHSELSKAKDKKSKSTSYMILGDVYNGLSDISTFMIPEENYEMCIKTSPHTQVSKQCFNKYVTNVVLGYSGSSGIDIPYFEKQKIEDLKKIAL